MNEQNAAPSGEGATSPAPATPENTSGTVSAPRSERINTQSKADNAKYAAARRKAEAERDEAIRQNQMQIAQSEQLRRQLSAEQTRTRDERARIVAEEQVRQIAGMDSTVHSVDDLLAMPEFDDFYALVKKGVTMVEAYKLTHYDALMKRSEERAARQAAQSVASRKHLSALAGGAGTGDYLSVPAEIAAQYRLAKPGISDSEIRRKYRRYKNYQRQ